MKLTDEAVKEIMAKISLLINKNLGDINKSWRNSDGESFAFGIQVKMGKATRDDEMVLVIIPTISFSEKHKESAEIVIDNPDQLKMT